MLEHGLTHLHPARFSNSRVGHIAIATDLIRGIYDDYTLCFCNDARRFTQQGSFADAWTAQNQHGLPRFDDILDDVHCPVDGAADAQGQADHRRPPVTNR